MKSSARFLIAFCSLLCANNAFAQDNTNLFDTPASQIGEKAYLENKFNEGTGELRSSINQVKDALPFCDTNNHCDGVLTGMASAGIGGALMAVGATVGLPVFIVGLGVVAVGGAVGAKVYLGPGASQWTPSSNLQYTPIPGSRLFTGQPYHLTKDVRIFEGQKDTSGPSLGIGNLSAPKPSAAGPAS
jgi:hypothetical protein